LDGIESSTYIDVWLQGVERSNVVGFTYISLLCFYCNFLYVSLLQGFVAISMMILLMILSYKEAKKLQMMWIYLEWATKLMTS